MGGKRTGTLPKVPKDKSCSSCNHPDNMQMVQCDRCDKWYHFECAQVSEEVANIDWNCDKCNATMKETNNEIFQSPLTRLDDRVENDLVCMNLNNKTPNASKCGSSKAKRKSKLLLMRLEEEKKANMIYIQEKYAVLMQESSDDSDFDNDVELQRVVHWVEDMSGDGISNEVGGRHKVNKGDRNNSGIGTSIQNYESHNSDGTGTLIQKESAQGAPQINAHAMHSAANTPSISTEQMCARQVVPRELPAFTGRPEEWPLFISSFETSTKLCGFSNDENLLRLQRALKGKAFDYVGSRLMLPALVPEIISTLRMAFGRPEYIINCLLANLRSSPGVNANKLQTLVSFSLEVKNITATMEASGLYSHLNNPLLLQELIEKLPAQMRLDWAIFSKSNKNVNLIIFSNWLFNLAESASSVISFSNPNVKQAESEKRNTHRVNFHKERSAELDRTAKGSPNLQKCYACNEAHLLTKCDKFKNLSYNTKWNIVHDKRLCRTCLKCHDLKYCQERRECGVNACTAKHHPLLHKPEITNGNSSTSQAVVAVHQLHTSKTLFRIVPITIYGKNTSVNVYAFLDDGSAPTLIEKSILDQLQVQGATSDLCLKWTDGTVRTEKGSQLVNLRVSSKANVNKRYSLRDVRSVSHLDLPSQTLMLSELTDKYKHLKGLPIESYTNIVPKVIIGINNKSVAMPLKFREGMPYEPAATKTRLGWTIYGELGQKSLDDVALNNVNLQLHICECDNDVALQKLIIENMKIEDDYCETQKQEKGFVDNKILQECVQRDGDRFVTRLLWKSSNITMPDNWELAMRRLRCFEAKLNKDPILRNQINSHIKNLEEKGYIRKLSDAEISANYSRKWYLPLFVVKNPNKPQKVRVVWDAAAECKGISLNGCLEKGPDYLTSLTEVLFNFRVGKIGICGDICEMFHRVAVHADDQQSQRFLWRNSEAVVSPDVYVLQVMSFGASCSPSLAQYVKNKNAHQYKDRFPRAVKSILERHYVDDMLDSVDSVQEAIQLARDVREVHKHANFHIRNWLSNSSDVILSLGDAGTSDQFCQAGKTVDQIVEADKVLGMWWETTRDTFTFNLKFTKASEDILCGVRLPTKRELLRLLMSIFDPLGLLSFYSIYMKILLQNIWRTGISWDDTIPDEYENAWKRWISLLKNVQEIHIPRCYFGILRNERSRVELHIFADASESAYAAVAYFRTLCENRVEISLVCSKTKVAPLRPISIPRMELLAAVMGARLGNAIIKAHDIKIDSTNYWCDSKTVLLWLQSDPRKYKQFVSFRIGEIQETTDISNWNYVPSKQNVADLATKWTQQPDFHRTSPWFEGPTFLREPQERWQRNAQLKEYNDCDDELRSTPKMQIAVQVQESNFTIDLTRFSRWERLLRCMAYVKRFVTRLKSPISLIKSVSPEAKLSNYKNLNSSELLWSQQFLYRLAQTQAFNRERRLLLQNTTASLPRSSPLRKLSPFFDKDSIIRMKGRLEKATVIGDETKNPIIMPKDHIITRLLVDWYHRRYKHANHETAINEIFQTFHIPGLRTLLRTIRSNCQLCKIQKLHPSPPEMGPLPQARLSAFTRPFSYVGIDFFGPFIVTIGRRSEKRYGAIITCLTCRAVHVEVAHSLTMNSCAIVIRNFIARRGTPIHIYSDNGTNLKATEKELREAYKQVDFNSLQAEFISPYTQWTFIPPASPHMGGAWERMVRSIKTVLYKIITPDTKMTDETLYNVLLEVESIINSRPLTYLSLDTAEQEALTPNHFLLGSSSGSKPPGKFDVTDRYTKLSWRYSQLLADRFWKRWVAEVLPLLTRRTNWFEKVKPIEVGDVVIIIDSNLPRHCWPKGIVTSTIAAKDGQVRSAVVRTLSGEYHRPAAKIAVLDVGKVYDSVD